MARHSYDKALNHEGSGRHVVEDRNSTGCRRGSLLRGLVTPTTRRRGTRGLVAAGDPQVRPLHDLPFGPTLPLCDGTSPSMCSIGSLLILIRLM